MKTEAALLRARKMKDVGQLHAKIENEFSTISNIFDKVIFNDAIDIEQIKASLLWENAK